MSTLSTLTSSLAAPLAVPVQALVARAGAWSVDSQQVARRNAMVANTALAARRRDREDVEGYFSRQPDQTIGAADSAGTVGTAGTEARVTLG